MVAPCFPVKLGSTGQSDTSIWTVKAKHDADGVVTITNMC